MSNLIELDRIPTIIKDRVVKYRDEFVIQSNEPHPISIVYGTWGVGKSTLLRQIKETYKNDALVVHFDATTTAEDLTEQLKSRMDLLTVIKNAKEQDDDFNVFGHYFEKYISNDMDKQFIAIKHMRLFPVIIVIDQWDLLAEGHPCYNIPLVNDNKAPLYVMAGSGSWNPKLSICTIRYNESQKLFMDKLYVYVNKLTKIDFNKVEAKEPNRITMSRDQINEKSNGIFSLVNSIIYSGLAECNEIIDSQLVQNIERVLLRAKVQDSNSQKQTIDDLARMLRFSEESDELELPNAFCRVTGVIDENGKFSHSRFQNAIKKVLLEDIILESLFYILKRLELISNDNHSMLGTFFEAIFWKQSKTIKTLKLVCTKPCITNIKKELKNSFSNVVCEEVLTLQWDKVASLDKSSDLLVYKNVYGVLIKMSPNFPLIDFVLAKEVQNEVRIYAIQITVQKYEDHKKTTDYYDEQALRSKKYGIKREGTDESEGKDKFISRFGMKNQTVEELLKTNFANGKDSKVVYVFISPNQTKLPCKNCFYIPETKWFSQSDTWIKRFLDSAKISI